MISEDAFPTKLKHPPPVRLRACAPSSLTPPQGGSGCWALCKGGERPAKGFSTTPQGKYACGAFTALAGNTSLIPSRRARRIEGLTRPRREGQTGRIGNASKGSALRYKRSFLGVVEKAPLTRGVGGRTRPGRERSWQGRMGGVGGNNTLPVPLALLRLETNPPGPPCQGGKGHAPAPETGFSTTPSRGE